jgi:uncharacterized protein YndB with AHSA1/START domain
MAESQFVHVTFIRTTIEKLWAALTEPEFTRQYWFATVQDCSWTQGAKWELKFPDGRVADKGEVLEIDPPHKLVLKWEHQIFPEMMADGPSRLTYLLEEHGETVKFTLIHEQAKADSKLIKGVSNGWPIILASLKSLLETGESIVATRSMPEGM